jgi:hypothetical protein
VVGGRWKVRSVRRVCDLRVRVAREEEEERV